MPFNLTITASLKNPFGCTNCSKSIVKSRRSLEVKNGCGLQSSLLAPKLEDHATPAGALSMLSVHQRVLKRPICLLGI